MWRIRLYLSVCLVFQTVRMCPLQVISRVSHQASPVVPGGVDGGGGVFGGDKYVRLRCGA